MKELRELIPHAGGMCLLDRVVGHSAHDIECTARSHLAPDHPLRRGGQLSALHLIEYAAQAMAAHGALVFGGIQQGMLAAVREVRLHAGSIDNIQGELTVKATKRFAQASGAIYDFSIRGGGQLLCEGRLAIAYR